MNSRSIIASDIPMTQSMFWPPAYVSRSAWLEHLPFAFWITDVHRPRVIVELGSHYGASYFAFCQAISQLGLDARSYAVDTWKGDEHAGFYGEDVFKVVREENEARYTAFSRLVRSTFEEAVNYFDDGSIDLLHIDGHHAYDSVRADFEQWKDKLSPRGLVLLHDTNVRERQFGVYRFVEELRQSYPVFDFTHGHGLSCVAVGPEQNEAVRALLDADGSDDARRDVRAIFSRLGRACFQAFENKSLSENEKTATGKLQGLTKRVEEGATALASVRADLSTRTRERDEARRELQKLTENTAFERGVLIQKLGELQIAQKQSVSVLEDTRSQIATFHQNYTAIRQVQEQEKLAALTQKVADADKAQKVLQEQMRREQDKARRDLEQANAKVRQLQASLDTRFKEIATLTKMLRTATEEQNASTLAPIATPQSDRTGGRFSHFARYSVGRAFSRKRRPRPPEMEEVLASGLFDKNWYCARYNVSRRGDRALAHFMEHALNGYSPGPNFDSSAYLASNPDVYDAQLNPLLHYVRHGKAEGRRLGARSH